MANINSIAINSNSNFYKVAADANATIDSMFDTIREMDETNDETTKKLEEMIDKVKSFKDSLDKKAKAKNERPISLKESKSTAMIPTTAVVKDAAPNENNTPIVKSSDRKTSQPNNEPDSIKSKYDALISGASDWTAPTINKNMLRRSTSDVYDDLDKSKRKKYAKYNLCIKDIKRSKSAFTNLISIIARNAESAVSLVDFTKAIADHKLRSENSFINSGLFIYKSSDEELISSTFEPDGYLELWIPLDVEKELILSSDYRVTHQVGYGSPILSGVIMSFNNMKKLLLDPKVIISPSLANTAGLYENGTVLHRDISTNDYWYQDIFMSNDVICDMYSL